MIEKLVASLPSRTPQERAALKKNAEAIALSPDDKRAGDARSVLEAIELFEAGLSVDLAKTARFDRVRAAFLACPATEAETKMLRTLYLAGRFVDHQDLASLLGWQPDAFSLHFGAMCRKRVAWLGLPPNRLQYSNLQEYQTDKPHYTALLADAEEGLGGLALTMADDVARALKDVGVIPVNAKPVGVYSRGKICELDYDGKGIWAKRYHP